LQTRDIAIVLAVLEHRVLSVVQIAALFWGKSDGAVSTYCRQRLRLLVEAGLLERQEQPQTLSEGRRPYLYLMTQAGCQLLVDELGYEPDEIDWTPASNRVTWSPFKAHQLALNDVFVAFKLGAPRVGWELKQWVDDRTLRRNHASDRVRIADHEGHELETALIPDAYLVLSLPDPLTGVERWLHFFIEVDRATEIVGDTSRSRRSWQRHIRAYNAYLDSVAVESRYRTRSIRVLTVTTSARRLSNLQAVTKAEGGRSRYWFTTREKLSPETVLQAPIWYKADGDEPVALMR